MNNFIGYVYVIECSINDKKYVGITNNITLRWYKHKSDAKNGCPYVLHRAMRKYGLENFSIRQVYEAHSRDDLLENEKFYIQQLNTHVKSNNGYNETFGGEAPMLGRKHTVETRKLMSEAKKGKPSNYKGKTSSQDTRQLLSKIHSKAVVQLDADNRVVAVHCSITHAASVVGISDSNISAVCRGKKKTAGGYKWQYYKDTE